MPRLWAFLQRSAEVQKMQAHMDSAQGESEEVPEVRKSILEQEQAEEEKGEVNAKG